ncbi:WD40-repeat-containing domain protein [Suillus lakei]|nr:WD40-repeat-containing domain protein [Suillus lakei]
MAAYVHHCMLTEGHSDSMNCLSFSSCRQYLATGRDDNCFIIWRLNDGSVLYQFVFNSPVNVAFWHLKLADIVIIGCEDGTLSQLANFCINDFTRRHFDLGVEGAVHCLDYDMHLGCFAISIGHHIYVVRESPDCKQPPSPFSKQHDKHHRPIHARGHFYDKGKVLIVCYLHHGVIAWKVDCMTQIWRLWPKDAPLMCVYTQFSSRSSAISPEIKALAVQTMHNGLFMFLISRSRPSRKFNLPGRINEEGCVLQVLFLSAGAKAICGSSTGEVCIWYMTSGEVFQTLLHGETVSLKCFQDDSSYIATASSEKGQNTCIQIWRAKTGKNQRRMFLLAEHENIRPSDICRCKLDYCPLAYIQGERYVLSKQT